jgi:SAM-dependent methyltransferase
VADIESDRVGKHWSRVVPLLNSVGELQRTRWWQHPAILRHINQRVCGRPLEGFSAGLNARCREVVGSRLPLERGISVGGGTGVKEMALLKAGIVKRFDVFEVAEARISAGREIAAREHLNAQIAFIQGNVFEDLDQDASYDLVHWNNALHHMPDVERAIEWSWQLLRPGGLFYMDDFVGPTYFGWTDQMLLAASAVRQSLPDRLLVNPRNPAALLPRVLQKVDPEKLKQSDPSEAADSGRILDCAIRRFPGAEVVLTGGVIYNLALSDVLANLTEKDQALLSRLLLLDDQCVGAGHTLYATALAFKV